MMKHTKHWKYLKWSAIVFWGLFLVYVIIINTGCTFVKELLLEEEPQVIEKEVIKEKIVYRDRNVTIPCDETPPPTIYNGSKARELELIRRLKFLEGQTDKYFNDSECNDNLNKTKDRLDKCENELCVEWNSSWC